MYVNPADTFQPPLLVIAPHMDDELLACGGTMALWPDKAEIHVIYATDGMKSPAPVNDTDQITPDLGESRQREAVAAMERLGVPATNLHFLGLPDGRLQAHLPALTKAIRAEIDQIQPATLFVPFRYDKHPDHLAIFHAIQSGQAAFAAQIFEYFVYFNSRLLRKGDVREYIDPQFRIMVDTARVAGVKREALDCFATQTTRYYSWQTRPILRPALLDAVSAAPEQFIRHDPSHPGAAIFTNARWWIPIANRLEPKLKDWKYIWITRLKQIGRRSGPDER